jgi:glutamate racemase
VEIITSGAPLARQVEHVLGARGLAHPRGDAEVLGAAMSDGDAVGAATHIVEGDYAFLCTGDVTAFRALGSRFLQMPLGEIEAVSLGEPAYAGGRR